MKNELNIRAASCAVSSAGYGVQTITIFNPDQNTLGLLRQLARKSLVELVAHMYHKVRLMDMTDTGREDAHVKDAPVHLIRAFCADAKEHTWILTTLTY